MIAETPGGLLSKYPRISHNHAFTYIVLSLGKWEERRIGAEVNYLIQDVLCHTPFQMEEMVEPEGEAWTRVQRAYGDVFFAFRMLWDNEPLEKSVGRPTGNGKLLSCHVLLKNNGQDIGQCIFAFWWMQSRVDIHHVPINLLVSTEVSLSLLSLENNSRSPCLWEFIVLLPVNFQFQETSLYLLYFPGEDTPNSV